MSLLRCRLATLMPLAALVSLSPLASRAEDAPVDPYKAVLNNLNWRSIGPATMGGRIDQFCFVESKPGLLYVATASGGVLKSLNYGTTWEPVFDFEETTTIGSVAVAPSNSEVVWVGTGEANNRQSSSWGDGVYKSIDGGKTWAHMGLKESSAVGEILIDPRNPDVVYVAAVGHLWKANPERGLFKTTDGGKTWEKVLYVNEDTGITDAKFDPSNPDVIYAAAYQRRRAPFGFNGGGPGSAIYKSSDAGKTWTKLTKGIPAEDKGRIGLAVSRTNPQVVYAIIETKAGSIYSTTGTGGVYRSEDGGENWTMQSDLDPRPMYYSHVFIDPTSDKKLWVLGVNLHYSEDAGKTWTVRPAQRIHSDFHAFWIDPKDPNHIFAGCDGGLWWSNDLGRTWDANNNFPIGQFYEIAYDMRKPYWVFGGLQDNFSWGGPSATPYTEGPVNDDWINIGGGDGFYNMVDWSNDDIVYQESQNGGITRLNIATGERKGIRPRPKPGDQPYRFDWNTPMLVSPHNPKKIFVAANRLFISHDRGDTWDRTDDLSGQPDRTKMPIMGVLVDPKKTLSANDGEDSFGQIVTISESPVKEGVLWAGTDDGNLQVSQDDGKTWKNVAANVPGMPKGTYVSRVVASKYAVGRCYVTFDGHRSGDFKPYIYVTEDFGATWQPLTNGIPEGHSLHVIREHHRNPNLLFAGTERGLYVSFDRGAKWNRVGKPLPSVPVDDIQIHRRDNDLILGTHGRSIWILDDITPFEQIAEAADKDAFLFQPRDTISWRISSKKGFFGNKPFLGTNPQQGAAIQYWLKTAPGDNDPFSLTILDKAGKIVVNSLSFAPKAAGLNKATWNMRVGTGSSVQVTGSAGGQGGGRRAGGGFRTPIVLPGTYTVRLVAGKTEITRPIVIEEDPRLRISAADRRAHFDAVMRLNSLFTLDRDARASLDKTKEAIDKLQGSDEFKTASEDLKKRVAEVAKRVKDTQDKLGGGTPAPGAPGAGGAGFARGGGRGGRSGGPGGSGGGAGAPGAQGRGPGGGAPGAGGAPAFSAQGEGAQGRRGGGGGGGFGGFGGGNTASLQGRIQSLVFSLDAITEVPSTGIKKESDQVEKDLKNVLRDVNEISAKVVPDLNRELEKAKMKAITGGAAVTAVAHPSQMLWAVTGIAEQASEDEEEEAGDGK